MTAAIETNLWYLPALALFGGECRVPATVYSPSCAAAPGTERFCIFLYLNVSAL
jgi:hypothetical protein